MVLNTRDNGFYYCLHRLCDMPIVCAHGVQPSISAICSRKRPEYMRASERCAVNPWHIAVGASIRASSRPGVRVWQGIADHANIQSGCRAVQSADKRRLMV